MKKHTKFPIIIIALSLILLMILPQFSIAEVGVTDTTIKLGATSPLTGPAAFIGGTCIRGTKVYFNYVNDQGGIHGRKIRFLVEDDAYVPAKTVMMGKKLIERDKIFAFASNQGTPTTLSLRKMIEIKKIPLVAPQMPARKDINDKYLFFSCLGDYIDQGGIMSEYLVNILGKKNASDTCEVPASQVAAVPPC